MAEPRRVTIPSVLLAIIAIVGGISLAFLLYSLQRELVEQRKIFGEDSVRIASEIEREARVFRNSLYLYIEETGDISLEDVKKRFDVLWSRIESMDKGTLGEIYLQLPGASSVLQQGRKMLRDVDPLLLELQPGDSISRKEIGVHLDPVIDNLYTVARNASEFTLQYQEKRRLSFEKTRNFTIVVVISIFLTGGVLFIILLRNQYHLDQLTDNLELVVKERTKELEASNYSLKMMSQAIEQSPVSVMICDREGKIEYVNQKFVEITGYHLEEAIGQSPGFIKSGMTSDKVYREMWQAVHADRVWKGEICNKKKNGELFWEHLALSPIKNSDNQISGFLAVKEDISQRKLYEEQLLKQANYDSLTALPNRVLAMDRLSQAILKVQRKGGTVALLFIDLDNFKNINDTMGHECGDVVLKKAAERLSGCLRDCDTAARFGGDEFIIILSELQGRDDVLPILDRILDAFSEPFEVQGQECIVTTSIGVSLCPQDSVAASQLLKNSDRAMYLAKNSGKNNYRFLDADVIN